MANEYAIIIRIATTSLAAWLACYFVLIIYRLLFNPLAKFPGPKLAAASGLYEAYFDLVQKGGGQFPFEIRRMHERYGHIVRINPRELHIDDPEYYGVLYSSSRAYDKSERFQYRFSIPDAAFSTPNAEVHKMRRAPLVSFFSKSKIRDQNNMIQSLIDRVSAILTNEYAGRNRVLNAQDVWSSFSADAIMDIVFMRPMNLCEAPDFRSPFTTAVNSVATWSHITLYFGWTLTIINNMPDWLAVRAFPPFRPVIQFRQEMERQIADILQDRNEEIKAAGGKSVFSQLVASDLPASELTPHRMLQEAQSLIGAGLETTAWILTIGTFHLLDNKDILQKLRNELENAIPDSAHIPTWVELEKLHYLSAVCKEMLRVGFGDVERLPRINRTGVWQYGDWTIPPGTPVSMDQFHMHMDTSVYGDPEIFRPERWLDDPVVAGPGGSRPLTDYLTPFGRGTRMCLGFNLAYAELYIAIATIFRRHEFELVDTTKRDVEFFSENLKACPWPGSKGVRFIVK